MRNQMTIRTLLLATALALAPLSAHAGNRCPVFANSADGYDVLVTICMPKKFTGDWISLGDFHDHMKVGAWNIDFGSSFIGDIISVVPGDESGTKVVVKYENAPHADVGMVLYLIKVNGRETLIGVNENSPTNISVYQRPRETK